MPAHKLHLENEYTPSSSDNSPHMTSLEKRSGSNIKPGLKKVVLTQEISKMQKRNNFDERHPALLQSSPKPSTSKDDSQFKEVSLVKVEKPESSFDEDDNDDFNVNDDFFHKLNQKIPYSYSEDEIILKFVLKGGNIHKVSSLTLWKYLETKKNKPKRTYQSLKNRFLRNIRPNIFKKFSHLVSDQETVKKVLMKFPELKQQCKLKDTYQKWKSPEPKRAKFAKDEVLQSDSSDTDCSFDDRKSSTPVGDIIKTLDDVNIHMALASKTQVKRIVKFYKETIRTTVNMFKAGNAEFSTGKSLSERFKKLMNSKRRGACSTCGRFSASSSESDAEHNSLIPNSVNDKNNPEVNFQKGNNVKRNGGANSQSLLISLENSDNFNDNSEESNGNSNAVEDVSEKDGNESVELIEIVDMPIKEDPKSGSTNSENEDINLIYENTVARFHRIIGADEERTLQRKCLNKNKDAIGFDVEVEKNIDSFFLETPSDAFTPVIENVYSKYNANDEDGDNDNDKSKTEAGTCSKEGHNVTASSELASNMMKMLKQTTSKKK